MSPASLAASITGYQRQRVHLDGRGSVDATHYSWTLLDPTDGTQLTERTESVAALTSSSPGEFRVRLTTTNQTGDESTAITIVTIKSAAISITGPAEGVEKQPMEFRAATSQLPSDAELSWSITRDGDGPNNSTAHQPDDGPLWRVNETSKTLTVVPTDTSPIRIQLTGHSNSVPDGLWASASKHVDIQSVPIEPVNPADAEWWQTKQETDTRAALGTVRATAATWQGYATALLTVFSTIALLAGPKTFAETDNGYVNVIILIVMAAAFIMAGTGIWRLSRVNATTPKIGPGVTGPEYAAQHVEATQQAEANFKSSKKLTISAAVVLGLGAFALSTYGAVIAAKDSPPNYVIVRTPTSTICGELSTDKDTGTMTVAGQQIGATDGVTPVDGC